jgi:hypothetical protein
MLVLAGCVNPFAGSNAQFDFQKAMPSQAAPGVMPDVTQLPSNTHFTFYAFQVDATAGRLYAVQDFEVHPVVDKNSPCFIDVGEHVEHPGLHVSQYEKVIDADVGIPDYTMPPASATELDKEKAGTAHERMVNIDKLLGSSGAGLFTVTSASSAQYDPAMVDSGCSDTSKIPAPTCTDETSNKRRLDLCQKFWHAHPGFFEGTDRSLTAPLAGTMHGMVVGVSPINFAPLGGAQFFVDDAIAGFDGYAVYWQYDDANGDGVPDYPMGVTPPPQPDPGTLLLFGRPTMPTRDVMHVHMTNDANSELTAELAIFANLDQDSTHF